MISGDDHVMGRVLDELKKLGFDGIELDSPNNLNPVEVLDARDKVGLPIHGVIDSAHWRDKLSDKDDKARARGRKALEQAIRDCRLYGGNTVLLVPGVVDRNTDYDDVWERSTTEIKAVLPLAKEMGVSIAIENLMALRIRLFSAKPFGMNAAMPAAAAAAERNVRRSSLES